MKAGPLVEAIAQPRRGMDRVVARLSNDSPESLFRAQHRLLVRLLRLVSGDEERAAEAVQDAFVQLCLHWPKVRSYDDPVGWLHYVTFNRLRGQHRSLADRSRGDSVEP